MSNPTHIQHTHTRARVRARGSQSRATSWLLPLVLLALLIVSGAAGTAASMVGVWS